MVAGQHTHFVVLEGYHSDGDSEHEAEHAAEPGTWPRYLLAKTSNARAPVPTVWTTKQFAASWSGVRRQALCPPQKSARPRINTHKKCACARASLMF